MPNHELDKDSPSHQLDILVVEDEPMVQDVIVKILKRNGYGTLLANDGAMALRMVESHRPALIILDVNLPTLGGFAALQILRERGMTVPVLMLSAQAESDRRVKGLGLGADDFISKPFDSRELLLRVAGLLRRNGNGQHRTVLLRRGDVTIDLSARTAERSGTPIPLTATEYAILEVLAREIGRPVSREQLLTKVWDYSSLPTTRTVETHIWRLRRKLRENTEKESWIQNRPGLGYALAEDVVASGHTGAGGGLAPSYLQPSSPAETPNGLTS